MRPILLLLFLCAAAQTTLPAVSVASLDLEFFLEHAQLLQSRYDKLKLKLDAYNASFRSLEEELNKLKTRIGMTAQADPKHDELMADFEAKKARFKAMQQLAEERVNREKGEVLQTTVRDCLGLLDTFCQERDIDLVIRTVAGLKDAQKSIALPELQVLYASPALDITEDFIAFANARFSPDEDEEPSAGSTFEGQRPAPLGPVVEAIPDEAGQ